MADDLAEAYYAVAADMQERGEMTLRAADMLFGVADQMSAARIRQKGMQQDQDRAAHELVALHARLQECERELMAYTGGACDYFKCHARFTGTASSAADNPEVREP